MSEQSAESAQSAQSGDLEAMEFRVSRRDLMKVALGIFLFGGSGALSRAAAAEDVPPEPDDLDEPTQWQEGDPEPYEMTVPAVEPDQTSQEAPPSQPMDDDRGEPPGEGHLWASGYWLWTNDKYVWVPGYWTKPPSAEYVYIPGYWAYQTTAWVYVHGGWGKPNTTVVVVRAEPRPAVKLFVFTAPIRIVRRHRRWRHHHARRGRHRARHRARRKPGGPGRGPGGPGHKPGGPGHGPGGPGRKR